MTAAVKCRVHYSMQQVLRVVTLGDIRVGEEVSVGRGIEYLVRYCSTRNFHKQNETKNRKVWQHERSDSSRKPNKVA